MGAFARAIEYALDAAVQGPHYTYPREHRRPATFGNEQQRFHRGLPLLRVVFCLGQFGEVSLRLNQIDEP
jgi:hypothetical protein